MSSQSQRVLRLGKKVSVWPVLPYRVRGKEEYFLVDWPSFWDDLTIEIGVVAVRKRNGRWKVVELELPEGIKDDDMEDIVLCHWRVFDQKDRRRKCPPVYMVWEFDSPPVFVAACEKPSQEKQVPFAKQLEEIKRETSLPEVTWENENLLDVLRQFGPGICTVVADAGILEFDILESGKFAERGFCPVCAGQPGMPTDEDVLLRFADLMADSLGASVTVRTFCNETVCIKNSRSELIRVPVKEIRGFLVKAVREKGKLVLRWEKLPPEIVKDCYSHDAETGEYVGLTVDERDHRFV